MESIATTWQNGVGTHRRDGLVRLMTGYMMAVVVYTAIYELPEVAARPGTRFILFALWGIALGGNLLLSKLHLSHPIRTILLLVVAFDGYCVLLDAIKYSGYTRSPLFYNMNLTAFFVFVGQMLTTLLDRDRVVRLAKTYVLTVLAITPYFAVKYFLPGQPYVGKNSLGPIMGFAVIILATVIQPKTRVWRVLRWVAIAALGACIFASFNRATMASMLVLAVYYAAALQPTVRRKLIGCVILAVIALGCMSSERVMDSLKTSAMVDLAGKGVDELSRGRVSLLHSGWQQFSDNQMLGVGRSYVENFHCSVLVQVGILGSIPVFLLYLYPFYMFTINLRLMRHDWLAALIGLMALHGVVMSIFEEQAPLGPGTSYFLLWLMIGYYQGQVRARGTGV